MTTPKDWYQQQETVLAECQRDSERHVTSNGELFSKVVWSEKASSWQEFVGWAGELLGEWCFRGQRDSEWPLRTSLDRAVKVNTSDYAFDLDRRSVESELLFRFQQQAHQFIRHVPPIDDKASWSALMQHYGVPTRLLDWTRSPYVALYFAIEEASRSTNSGKSQKDGIKAENTTTENERNAAIWAIDLNWLEVKEKEHLGPIPEDTKTRTAYLNSILDQSEKPLIVKIDPPEANERMFAQQGFFLWKLLEGAPFFDQILISMALDPILERPVIRKLEVPDRLRIRFLKNLRGMNVHRASLFPGLDGFCQSLKMDLEIKVDDKSTEQQVLDDTLRDAFGEI
jgi:hypothetical protein